MYKTKNNHCYCSNEHVHVYVKLLNILKESVPYLNINVKDNKKYFAVFLSFKSFNCLFYRFICSV